VNAARFSQLEVALQNRNPASQSQEYPEARDGKNCGEETHLATSCSDAGAGWQHMRQRL
jgi:hypothetical protein